VLAQPVDEGRLLTEILVVEDEVPIAEAIQLRLESESYSVRLAHTGPDAITAAKENRPDLVLLDLMLPGMNGIDVCRELQKSDSVPVLMLTARTDEADKIAGFAAGADDYLTKPFSMRELTMRVRAILRRTEGSSSAPSGPLELNDLEIDVGRRRVARDGTEIRLTPLQFDILRSLASEPGVVWSRERLQDEVWGDRDPAGSRVVDTHVASLRRKLQDDASEPRYVRTVFGVGYASVES
jgi:DNA-binding response OmpR family regulator